MPLPTAIVNLDASTLSLSNDDDVSSFANAGSSGGSADNLYGSPPVYRATEFNGKPSVYFDGGADLTLGSVNVAQPCTFVIVANDEDFSTFGRIFDADGDTTDRMIFSSDGTGMQMYAGSPVSAADSAPTGPSIWVAIYDGAFSELWKNGTLVASGDTGDGGAGLIDMNIGVDQNEADYHFVGHLAQLIGYGAHLNSTQIAQVFNQMNTKWGFITSGPNRVGGLINWPASLNVGQPISI